MSDRSLAGANPAPGGSTPSVLARILDSTRAEVERRKLAVPVTELQVRAAAQAQRDPDEGRSEQSSAARRGFRDALNAPGIGVIAEFKRRSPSAGLLRESASIAEIVKAYERGGACALSVLTEGPNFAGSLDDLRSARAACALPVLRKDFVIDSYQLHEAEAAGADAVLLIVAALNAERLGELHGHARSLGLDVLVEVHDRRELELALALGADTIGVNNRDLRDFSIDVERTFELLGDIPADVTVVSESGIAAPEQLLRLAEAGVAAVLVGELLMRASDPAHALGALLGAGAGVANGARSTGSKF
jgi:indole-3-glycerol phosphate synthase